ncbi:hypothetical protein EON81_01175 [bacterium]|nr:MAG: hypothetical protein EON81_01175 [bacterium]
MLLPLLATMQSPVRLEAEDAARTGATVVTERAGYGGAGYVTGFQANDSSLVWMTDIPKAGIYNARLRYATPGGYKEADLEANGLKTGIVLPASGDAFAEGVVARLELTKGQNTIALRRGWGYYDVDWLELTPAPTPKAPKPVPVKPSDPGANVAVKNLLARLAKGYGKVTLSGQYDLDDTRFVLETTGKRPAIFGGDLIEFSPTRRERGSKVAGTVEEWIKQSKAGALLTLSWHWNAPTGLIDTKTPEKDLSWYRGFYTGRKGQTGRTTNFCSGTSTPSPCR